MSYKLIPSCCTVPLLFDYTFKGTTFGFRVCVAASGAYHTFLLVLIASCCYRTPLSKKAIARIEKRAEQRELVTQLKILLTQEAEAMEKLTASIASTEATTIRGSEFQLTGLFSWTLTKWGRFPGGCTFLPRGQFYIDVSYIHLYLLLSRHYCSIFMYAIQFI